MWKEVTCFRLFFSLYCDVNFHGDLREDMMLGQETAVHESLDMPLTSFLEGCKLVLELGKGHRGKSIYKMTMNVVKIEACLLVFGFSKNSS